MTTARKKLDIKARNLNGNSSAPSRGVVVLNVRPPKWNSFLDNPASDANIDNLTFNNFFVYNFFSVGENRKYDYFNSKFDFTSLVGIDGKKIQKNDNKTLRKVTGFIPSYIRLHWEPSDVWGNNNIGTHKQIEDFKKIVGLESLNPETDNIINPKQIRGPEFERGGVSFEVHQRDYIDLTNEYLDMFSDLSMLASPSKNPWFAEEIDDFDSIERLTFLKAQTVGNLDNVYKNGLFRGNSLVKSPNPLEPRNRLVPSRVPTEAIPTVQDSAMLEDLQYPKFHSAPDITLILNSESSVDISKSSLRSSGGILSTQSQIRNMRHLIEHTSNLSLEDEESYSTPIDKILSRGNHYKESDFGISQGGGNLNHNKISEFKLVGFVIEKKETFAPGRSSISKSIKYPLIFVPCLRNPDESSPSIPNTYLDPALNYGSKYCYTIRSVFSFSVVINDTDNEIATKREYLVNSTYSQQLEIDCRETTPPPPPRDFSIFFDYTLKNRRSLGMPRLTWAFPVNLQRDTAGFAIFRRKNIYEPFNLLKIIDFNFSLSENERINNFKFKVKKELIHLLKKGDIFTNYLDENFKYNTNYIYTVCSIDAHGQISNYGVQLLVNFDSKLNRLHYEQMSPPGAPLIYPNWFLKTKAFQDVARVSRYRKAILKFRPDYKEIRTKAGKEKVKIVNGIDSESGGHKDNSYFLQIINPDRANDVVLKYQINDVIELTQSAEELEEVALLLGVTERDLK